MSTPAAPAPASSQLGGMISAELLPIFIESVLTHEAGRQWFRKNSDFLRRTQFPGAPIASESDLALLESDNTAVEKSQEERAQLLHSLFFFADQIASTSKGIMIEVLQQGIAKAVQEKKPLTACAMRLLRKLSRRFPELVDTLSRAEASKATDTTESVNRSPSQGAASSGTQMSFGSSATTFDDALTLAMKVSFFREQLTEEERLTAASLLGTDFSAA